MIKHLLAAFVLTTSLFTAVHADTATRLSEREREVAELAACGLHDKEIARRLGISITTVRTHIDHAFRKLNVNNRMTLVHKLNL